MTLLLQFLVLTAIIILHHVKTASYWGALSPLFVRPLDSEKRSLNMLYFGRPFLNALFFFVSLLFPLSLTPFNIFCGWSPENLCSIDWDLCRHQYRSQHSAKGFALPACPLASLTYIRSEEKPFHWVSFEVIIVSGVRYFDKRGPLFYTVQPYWLFDLWPFHFLFSQNEVSQNAAINRGLDSKQRKKKAKTPTPKISCCSIFQQSTTKRLQRKSICASKFGWIDQPKIFSMILKKHFSERLSNYRRSTRIFLNICLDIQSDSLVLSWR